VGNTSTTTSPLTIANFAFSSIAGDNAINAAERLGGVTITGSQEPGARVFLTLGSQSPQEATQTSSTGWSYTLTTADFAALVQGNNTFTFTVRDANNLATSITQTVLFDTVVPDAAHHQYRGR